MIYSILHNKCPRCHQGAFFKYNNPYHLTQFTKCHKECNACKQKYELEPGFYFGAMYVSYALNVAWFVISWTGTQLIIAKEDVWLRLSIILGFIILLYPITYRFSRLVYINLFVKYKAPQAFL